MLHCRRRAPSCHHARPKAPSAARPTNEAGCLVGEVSQILRKGLLVPVLQGDEDRRAKQMSPYNAIAILLTGQNHVVICSTITLLARAKAAS